MGYEPLSKGYTLWDRHSRCFISSRDVTFDEATFLSRADVGNQRTTTPSSIPPGGVINNPGDVLSFPYSKPSQLLSAVATVAPQAPQIQVAPPNIQVLEVPPLQQTQPHTPPDQTPTPVDHTIYQTPPSHPPATSPPA